MKYSINKFEVNDINIDLLGNDISNNKYSHSPVSCKSASEEIEKLKLSTSNIINLSSVDFIDMMFDGNGIIKSNTNYNAYVIRIPENVNSFRIVNKGSLQSMILIDSYPYIGLNEFKLLDTTEVSYYDLYIDKTYYNKYLFITCRLTDYAELSIQFIKQFIQNVSYENDRTYKWLGDVLISSKIDSRYLQYNDDNGIEHYCVCSSDTFTRNRYYWNEIDKSYSAKHIFKYDSKVYFPAGNPFIDIIVVSNPQNIEHIYLGAYYNDMNAHCFGIVFYNDNDEQISSHYVPRNYDGIQSITCTNNETELTIVCIVNTDLMKVLVQDKLPYKMEIYQKDSSPVYADYIKMSNGNFLIDYLNKTNDIIYIKAGEPLSIKIDKKTDTDYIKLNMLSGKLQIFSILNNSKNTLLYHGYINMTQQIIYPDNCDTVYIFTDNVGTEDFIGYIEHYTNTEFLSNHQRTERFFANAIDTDHSRFAAYVNNINVEYFVVNKNSGDINQFYLYSGIKNGIELIQDLVNYGAYEFGKIYKLPDINSEHNTLYFFNSSHNINSDLNVTIQLFDSESIISDVYNYVDYKTELIKPNKNVVLFGDSISEFKLNGKGISEHLSEISGYTVYNCAIGGTRLAVRPMTNQINISYGTLDISNMVKHWTTNDYTSAEEAVLYLKENASDDNTSVLNTVKSITPQETDIVIIFGGSNDYTGASVLGDKDSENLNDIYGALNNMFRMILTANPAIEIYVFTPIVRYVENIRDDAHWSDNYKISNRTLKELSDLIYEHCISHHIPTNNWYYTLGINQYNFSNYFQDNDGTHPFKGFKYLAEKMYKFIQSN